MMLVNRDRKRSFPVSGRSDLMRQTGKDISLVNRRYTLLTTVVDFIIALVLSERLTGLPEFGGALFISLQVWVLYFRLFRKRVLAALPQRIRKRRAYVLGASLFLSAMLFILYPEIIDAPHSIVLFGVLILMQARSFALDIVISTSRRPSLRTQWVRRRARRLSTWIILFSLAGVTALAFLVGESTARRTTIIAFLISSILVIILQIVDHASTVRLPKKSVDEIRDIRSIGVYNIYIKTITYILIAVQVVLMMFVSYLIYLPSISLTEMVISLVILSVLVPFTIAVVDRLIKRFHWKDFGANTLIILGAALWLVSSYALFRSLDQGRTIVIFVFMLQSIIGAALVFTAVFSMEHDIREVVRFVRGDVDEDILTINAGMTYEWALLMGQILSLLVFTLIGALRGGAAEEIRYGITITKFAFTLLPAVFIWLALNSSLKQPLTREYVEKLRRYFTLKKQGLENERLTERLNLVLVKKYTRRYGLKLLALLFKPFWYHKVIGKEKVKDKDGSVIFICNHGKLYGPVITNLYVPFDFRPWIISHMIGIEEVTQYIYSGWFSKRKWIPKRMRMRISRLFAPLLAWAMRSTDPIPVYRESIGKLKKTVELTLEAMEAEYNILIFPEDNTEKGYRSDQVINFFTGFASLGRAYYKRTGRRTVFYPVYASRKKRIISFGDGITYDPSNDARSEKQRIIQSLREAISRQAAAIEGTSPLEDED